MTMGWACHINVIHTGILHRKGYIMLHHLAGATIKFTNLVNYKCHPHVNIIYLHFSYKKTGTTCKDDARVKVPSFQKVTFYYNIKYSTETLFIYIFVRLKMLLAAVI